MPGTRRYTQVHTTHCCQEHILTLTLCCCRSIALQGLGTYLSERTRCSGPQLPALITTEQEQQLAAAPAIVHFTGPPSITPAQLLNPYVKPPSKPWAFVCLNPYKDAWFRVLDSTPWAGWQLRQSDFEAAAVQELLGLCIKLSTPGSNAGHQSTEQNCELGVAGSGGHSEARVLAAAVCCAAGFDTSAFVKHVAEALHAAHAPGGP